VDRPAGALRDRDRGQLGERIAQHVAKGDKVVVASRLRWPVCETAARRRRDGHWVAVAHG